MAEAERPSDVSSASSEEEDNVQDQEVNNNSSPWPYLDKFMTLIKTNETKFVFTCLLCKPQNKLLSTSKTSSTNLKTHIKVS